MLTVNGTETIIQYLLFDHLSTVVIDFHKMLSENLLHEMKFYYCLLLPLYLFL